MHERPRDTSLAIIGVSAVGFSHDAQSLSQGHEEKMFISFILWFVEKRLDSMALLLCFSCRDGYRWRTLLPQPSYAARGRRGASRKERVLASARCRSSQALTTRRVSPLPATNPFQGSCPGPAGTSADGGGPPRAGARQAVPGDLARQDPSHAVRPAKGGSHHNITPSDFAISIAF
jgi:hypothetical protein